MAKQKPDITLQTAVDGHLRHVQSAFSPNTLDDYKRTHAQFVAFIGAGRMFRTITAGDVESFLIQMRETPTAPNAVTGRQSSKKRGPKSIVNMHIALSSLWTWAVKMEHTDKHIMRLVVRPKAPQPPVKVLNTEQLVKLLRACEESAPWKNKPLTNNRRPSVDRDKAIVAVLVETAVRVEELCNLRFKDVTFSRQGGAVHVELGKGNKSRDIPFSSRCARFIKSYLLSRPNIQPQDPLFVNVQRNPNKAMTRSAVLQLIKKLGKKTGVDISPHGLRRTAATMMARNGMNAFDLQMIMGHADLQTTMRYVEAAQINLEEAMKRYSPLDNLRL